MINCCFSFIVIGMLVLVANKIIVAVLSSGNGGIDIFQYSYPTKDQVEAFADSMSGCFFKLLTLTVISAMIIFNMFNDIEAITKTISGGGSVGGMGKKVAGDAAQPLAKLAKEPAKFAGSMAKEGAQMLKETKAGQAVTKKARQFKQGVKNLFGVKG